MLYLGGKFRNDKLLGSMQRYLLPSTHLLLFLIFPSLLLGSSFSSYSKNKISASCLKILAQTTCRLACLASACMFSSTFLNATFSMGRNKKYAIICSLSAAEKYILPSSREFSSGIVLLKITFILHFQLFPVPMCPWGLSRQWREQSILCTQILLPSVWATGLTKVEKRWNTL